MFIRAKMRNGQPRYYFVKSVRTTDAEGKSKVRQKVLAYLGAFDSIEDCYANAGPKKRRKLAMYRDPQDVWDDQRERSLERDYKRQTVPRDVVRQILPHLPARMLPDA